MEVMGAAIVAYLAVYLVILGLGLVQYIFQSLSLHTMAKRRGISNPWLAWVPVGNVWIMGCISDQYQYVARGQNKSKRKLLVGLNIAMLIICVLYTVFMVMMLIAQENGEHMAVGALGLILVALAMLVVAIWSCILSYMAQFDYFRSADPDNATLYLVLGILLGSIVSTILFFICRNKDGGMPPRQVAAPVAAPMEPWQGNV